MNAQIERRGAPSLFGAAMPAGGGPRIPSLMDLLHEGFHLLFLLKSGAEPPDGAAFADKVARYMADVESEARRLRAHGDDIEAAKYAYYAALDEIILASGFAIRAQWELRPMQLTEFGDQLAGEHFFDRLEQLRVKGGARLQSLQVFHLCLLLGFKGKYALDSSDKLAYLTARLGDEIAHLKGRSPGLAPRAARPDQVAHKLRSDVPLWALSSMFALAALCAWLAMKSSLDNATRHSMAPYAGLVKLAPRPASFTVTLP